MIDDLLSESGNSPATPESIAACEQALGISFPSDYRRFLLKSEGFNGDVGAGYLVLWSLAEVAASDGYEFFPVAKDRFLIGSNGGPTAYAIFDGAYVSVPFAGNVPDELRHLGPGFDAFVEAIARGEGY